MKKVSGSLRLDLAQYRELAAFAQFGSDLDAATQRQLTRGAAMVELLKQNQYVPLAMEEQVLQIFAGGKGFYDKLEVSKVRAAADGYIKYLREKYNDVIETIRTSGKIDDVADKAEQAAKEYFATL
jgi:F-type H+-transporting ATPase subunit alpha